MNEEETRNYSSDIKAHRGRTKKGKVAVTIRLTGGELSRLDKIATRECRSRGGQCTWFVLQALGCGK